MKALIFAFTVSLLGFSQNAYSDSVPAGQPEASTVAVSSSSDDAFKEAVKYHHGVDGVKPDIKKALALYQKSAQTGNAEALLILGTFYDKGKEVEQNWEKALKYYTEAADKGLTEAEFNIASMYYAGEGVEQSYAKAAQWFEKSALNGNPKSAFNLGAMYYNGDGLKQDESQAKYWFKVSARNGNPAAALVMKFFGHDIELISRDLNNI